MIRAAAALVVVLLSTAALTGCADVRDAGQAGGACTRTAVAGDTTLADAVADAGPGDVVCLSGTFDERLLVPAGGTADAPLVIRSLDPGEPAVLRPTGAVPEGDQGVVELRDVSHVRIDGLELTGWQTDELGHTPAGILVTSSGTTAVQGIEILRTRIHDLGHTHPASFTAAELEGCEEPVATCAGDLAFDVQAFGIVVKGRAATPIRDLRIHGNHLEALTLGGSEALAVNGNVEGFEVTDNVLLDVDNIAIDAIGYEDLDAYPAGTPPEQTVARQGLIARNRIGDVSSDGNPAYGRYDDSGRAVGFDRSAVGVYVDGGRDVVVEANTVVRADIGIEVAAEYDLGATRDTVVRSNVIGLPDFAGIAVGGYAAEEDDDGVPPDAAYNGEGDAVGIQVVHNTVHTSGGGAAVVVQHRVTASTIAGNLLVAAPGEAVVGTHPGALDDVERAGDLELVGDGPEANPDGAFLSADLPDAAALAAGGAALRSWLHLAPGSPAIDAGRAVTDGGTVLAVGDADVDGDPRVAGTIDVGADEVAAGVRAARIEGPNRFATAAAIAAVDHPAGADVVVVARADQLADALAAAPVAVAADAPVLVTATDALPQETAQALDALSPGRVVVLGGPAAVSDDVVAVLSQTAEVQRIAGPDRYATAAAAAAALAADGGIGVDDRGRRLAVVAEAGDPRGALAAGVPAAVGRFPILLADADRLPEATRSALVDHAIEVVELIGGPAQLSEGVRASIEQLGIEVVRTGGPTPLDTVIAVARMGAARELLAGEGAVLGRGDVVVDALTVGPHAAARGVPILLAEGPEVLGEPARGWLADPSTRAVGLLEAIGGTAAVGEGVLAEAVEAVTGR